MLDLGRIAVGITGYRTLGNANEKGAGVGSDLENRERAILHIDDDPQLTRMVARQLETRGFNVVSLNDPKLATRELVLQQRRVVLLDIDMPGINGLDLLREIKSYDGGIQVIMLTGLVNLTTVLQSLRLGAEACFFKPVDDVEPLVDALNAVFAKIDRWWHTLEELSERRRSQPVTIGAG
jgi:DNA-binding NtrC family response regulator